MNVLSVDYDFFFPDAHMFDWFTNEDSPVPNEFLWLLRWSNTQVLSHNKLEQSANELYKPDRSLIDSFWNKVLANTYHPSILIICESHQKIELIFSTTNSNFSVWNFDQHHDMGYQNNSKLDCSNWVNVFKKRITDYHLVYPQWRLDTPENKQLPKHVDVHYIIPEKLPAFDIIFICRSPSWTPSWEDDCWIKLIDWFKQKHADLWDTKISQESALQKRYFDIEKAREIKNKFKLL